MSPDETIEQSIRCYPSVHRNRSQVLDHLFFTIGNGYEWINGELVNPFPYKTEFEPHYSLTNAIERGTVDASDLRRSMESDFEDRCISEESVERSKRYGVFSPYPESDLSRINNLPDNITPEWAAAAREAREDRKRFIATCPFTVTYEGSIAAATGRSTPEEARALYKWYKKENV